MAAARVVSTTTEFCTLAKAPKSATTELEQAAGEGPNPRRAIP
jgi:hypothetical protein